MSDPDEFRDVGTRDADFLGAFGVLEDERGILMVQNERVIGGVEQKVWDLPGGQVHSGELLGEALVRELAEETGLTVRPPLEFLFFQEGERVFRDARRHAWRSFFFSVASWAGEAAAGSEVLAVDWVPRTAMPERLSAPYHNSFLAWLEKGGTAFDCRWGDPQ